MGRTKRDVICYIQFTNPEPYPPLEHSSTMFTECDCRCEFLARRNELVGHITFKENPNREVKFLHSFWSFFPTKVEYAAFTLWTIGMVIWTRPKLVYCSDPFSTFIGCILSRMGVPVVYHEHDSPSPHASGFFHRTRKKMMRQAVAVIVPNVNRLTLEERERTGQRLREVRNMPSKHEVFDLKWSNSPSLRLVYFGTIVPSRLPLELIEALAKNERETVLDIIGYETSESEGYVKKLMTQAENTRLQIRFLGAMGRQKMLDLASHSDMGLLFFTETDDINEGNMLGASNKLYDYHLAGLPILHNSAEISRLTSQWNGLFYLPHIANLGTSLAEVKEAYNQMEKRKSLVETILTHDNYETAFAPVLEDLMQL